MMVLWMNGATLSGMGESFMSLPQTKQNGKVLKNVLGLQLGFYFLIVCGMK